ncbi:MAG: hypothetical protein J5852_08075 [Clostridia bacterium]|nr:hypothetical protein [Clostridia bacterium]
MEFKKPFILANPTGIILALLFAVCCIAALMTGGILTVLSGFIGITLITARLFNKGSVWTETVIMLVIAIICACKMWSENQFESTFKNIFSIFFEYNLFFALFVGIISITGLFGLVEKGGKGRYALIAVLALLLPSVSMMFLEIIEIVVGTILFVLMIIAGVTGSFSLYFKSSGTSAAPVFRDQKGNIHFDAMSMDKANERINSDKGE